MAFAIDFGWTGFTVEVKGAMMTKVEWEAPDPGVDIFIKEVGLVLVDVHPVDAAPNQAIFMCVEWLEDLLAAFAIHKRSQE